MQVKVYRSSVKDGLYIYLGFETPLNELPAPVMKQLGEPEKALEFDLTEARQLPNANAKEVLASIESQGFYIQMPPNTDVETLLTRAAQANTSPKK